MYSTLFLVSHVARTAHLRNPLAASSASLNAFPVAVTRILVSLKHAYTGAANNSTDVTNALMSCKRTLQLDKPSNLALFLILANAILAFTTLQCNMCAGDVALATISTPKYLNCLHSCSLFLAICISPLHYTNMTSVFFTLMTRSFASQKLLKIVTRCCSFSTDGAMSTISSANANINTLMHATVKSRFYYLVRDFSVKCCIIY